MKNLTVKILTLGANIGPSPEAAFSVAAPEMQEAIDACAFPMLNVRQVQDFPFAKPTQEFDMVINKIWIDGDDVFADITMVVQPSPVADAPDEYRWFPRLRGNADPMGITLNRERQLVEFSITGVGYAA